MASSVIGRSGYQEAMAKGLTSFQDAGSGFNTIDVRHARARDVDVMNTPGANANAVAEEVIASACARGLSLQLPVDSVVAQECQSGVETRVEASKISEGWMGLDIGPQTVKNFQREIARAQTIFWNGPLGVFEIEEFSQGTVVIAKAVADSPALSVVGGGDSVTAVIQSGLGNSISHLSTGGGASLTFMAGRTLPGVAILTDQ